ncbi:hypothetical protein [Clostridium cylindrosporum]|uniref:Phage-like protein n=1 Tax=Clostridium cylindrosporum DSM 605 TaxID=1121307 RepID=A0A0J8G1G6_CLOCY|nr:hypothetical protein [Clostridium cylindrosporum]KMT21601.1 phage-like protein [Clostridium cylindrosporum DSM 605]
MAEFAGFFNSVNGDRKYKSEDFAKYFKSFITNGVSSAKDSLKVFKKNNTQIEIASGSAVINGYLYLNDSTLIKGISTGITRIDRIVLRLDLVNRTLEIHVKQGSETIAPTLERNNSIYELSLAKVNITGLDFTIIDERSDVNVCGFMGFTGIVDIQEMWNLFNKNISDKNTVWDQWFNSLQGKSIRGIYIQNTQPVAVIGDIWINTI